MIGPPCMIGLLLLFLGIVMPSSSSSSSSADADAARRMIGVIISVRLLLVRRLADVPGGGAVGSSSSSISEHF